MLFPKKNFLFLFVGLVTVVFVFSVLFFGVSLLKPKVSPELVFDPRVLQSSQIVVGQPVKWVAVINSKDLKNNQRFLQLPKSAERINAKDASEAQKDKDLSYLQDAQGSKERSENALDKKSSFEAALLPVAQNLLADIYYKIKDLLNLHLVSQGQSKFYDVASLGTGGNYIEIHYQTPAPEIKGKVLNGLKEVTISDPSNSGYKNVLAYTALPKVYKVGQEGRIKVQWKNNGGQKVPFKAEDANGDGYLDYIQWTIPHLSDQIFDIIFISQAFQLDEKQNVVADIYGEVKAKDGVWASIPAGNYVRATFHQILDNTKDNTIYAKPTNPNQFAKIEVYPVYKDQNGDYMEGDKVADFPQIGQEGLYKVLLTSLQNPTDTFDLKIIGGVDIDFIVDPAARDLYWVAGTGDWSDATNHWATSSGGSPDAGNLPTSADNVYFDSSSGTGTVTLDEDVSVVGFDLSSSNITVNTDVYNYDVAVSGSISISAGTLTGGGNVTVLGGSVTGNGTINMTDGIFLIDGTGSFGGSTDWTFYNLTFGDGSGATATSKTGSNNVTVLRDLKIGNSQTLEAGSNNWNLSWSAGTNVLYGISQIAAGFYHTVAVSADGTAVYAWGMNNYGQLGDGTTSAKGTPVRVLKGAQSESTTYLGDAGGNSAIVAVATVGAGSSGNTVALTADGTAVYIWGYNGHGQLGNGNTANSYTPVRVLKGAQSESTTYLGDAGGNSRIVAISSISSSNAGSLMALSADGTAVYTWGYNYYGQLGDGTTTGRTTPVRVLKGEQSESTTYLGDAGGNSAIVAIAGGVMEGMAVTVDGTAVYTWGYNYYGQLGNNSTTQSTTPVRVLKGAQSESATYLGDAGGNSAITAISSGLYQGMALTADGKAVYDWGYNSMGQLGINSADSSAHSVPVRVLKGAQSGSTTYLGDAGGNLAIGKIIASGGYYNMAITVDGTAVYAWGYNAYGQLGDNSQSSRYAPVRVLKGAQSESTTYLGDAGGSSAIVAAGSDGIQYAYHSFALTQGGDVYIWGNNSYGQLGDGTTTLKKTPIKPLDYSDQGSVTNVSLNNISKIAASETFSVAVSSDGTAVYTWGNGWQGNLGIGNNVSTSTPVRVLKGAQSESTTYLGDAGGNSAIVDIASGVLHALAVTEGGAVYAWGYNGTGELGDGTGSARYTPVRVVKGAQSESTTYLGDAGGGSKIVKVAAALYDSAAVTAGGAVYTWGRGTNGQLGNNSTSSSTSPVRVVKGEQSESTTYLGDAGGDSAIIDVTCGYLHMAAITADGKGLYSWGYNNVGQLANNSTSQSQTPVRALKGAQSESTTYLGDAGGDSAIVDIASGIYHTLALTADGTAVYGLGYSGHGELGSGNWTGTNTTPVRALKGEQSESTTYLGDAGGNSAIAGVMGGGYGSSAFTVGGTVYAWGYNASGQLGNGNTTTKNTPVRVLKGEQSESTTYLGDVGGDSKIVALAAGFTYGYDTLALTGGGKVYGWGNNVYAQLGNNSSENSNTPVNVVMPAHNDLIVNGTLTPQSSTFVYNGDYYNIDGSLAYMAVGSTECNKLTINNSAGEYALIDDKTVGSDMTLTAGIFDLGEKNLTVAGNSDVSGGTAIIRKSYSSGWTTTDMTIESGGVVTSHSASKINVSGNWNSSGGTFTPDTGTVTLNGSAQTISGSPTFNNLVISKLNSPTISFTSGTTTTISGSFIAAGDATHQITIGATTTSAATLSKTSGTVSAHYCTISYSTATGGATWNALISTDNGYNSGWVFPSGTSPGGVGTGIKIGTGIEIQ